MSTQASHALHYAHCLNGTEWKNRVIRGWQIVRFCNLLRHHVLRFYYIKSDGSTRIAYGTLRSELIPEDLRPKGIVNRHPIYKTVTYFDVEKNEWRSFSIDKLNTTDIWTTKPWWIMDAPINIV